VATLNATIALRLNTRVTGRGVFMTWQEP
jgi:hypothetical protein